MERKIVMKIRNVFSKIHTHKTIEHTPEVTLSAEKLREKAKRNSDRLYNWRTANSQLYALYDFCQFLQHEFKQELKEEQIKELIKEFCSKFNSAQHDLTALQQKEGFQEFFNELKIKLFQAVQPAIAKDTALTHQTEIRLAILSLDLENVWLPSNGVLGTLKEVIYSNCLAPHSPMAYKMEKIGQKVKSLDKQLDNNYNNLQQLKRKFHSKQDSISVINNQLSNQMDWLENQLNILANFYVNDQ